MLLALVIATWLLILAYLVSISLFTRRLESLSKTKGLKDDAASTRGFSLGASVNSLRALWSRRVQESADPYLKSLAWVARISLILWSCGLIYIFSRQFDRIFQGPPSLVGLVGQSWEEWLTFVAFVVYLALAFGTCRRLRKEHSRTWSELGEPSLFNWTISTTLSILGFIWGRRHATLDDPFLTKLVIATRLLFILLLILFVRIGAF